MKSAPLVKATRASDEGVDYASAPDSLRALLDDLVTYLRRYAVLSREQSDALALWVVHTHAIDAFDLTLYIVITSPEKRCGKSRLLRLLALVVARAWLTGRTTAAALIRKVSRQKSTLLLDESDAMFHGEKEYAEALRGILNDGNVRGGCSTLCVGKGTNIEARDFDVFGPKALAGIGRLADTIMDRSTVIEMRRRRKDEPVEKIRRRAVEPIAAQLRQRAASWAEKAIAQLRETAPTVPDLNDDRAEEGWETLLAIAEAAGGEWPRRGHDAAVALSGTAARDDDSSGVLLLGDCQRAFCREERLHTEPLLQRLNEMEESPWATWHHGKPLSARGLSQKLRPFGIRSQQLKIGDVNRNGYLRQDFEDAWLRYGVLSSTDSTAQDDQGFPAETQTLPSIGGRGCENAENPHGIRPVEAVEDDERYPYTPEEIEEMAPDDDENGSAEALLDYAEAVFSLNERPAHNAFS